MYKSEQEQAHETLPNASWFRWIITGWMVKLSHLNKPWPLYTSQLHVHVWKCVELKALNFLKFSNITSIRVKSAMVKFILPCYGYIIYTRAVLISVNLEKCLLGIPQYKLLPIPLQRRANGIHLGLVQTKTSFCDLISTSNSPPNWRFTYASPPQDMLHNMDLTQTSAETWPYSNAHKSQLSLLISCFLWRCNAHSAWVTPRYPI